MQALRALAEGVGAPSTVEVLEMKREPGAHVGSKIVSRAGRRRAHRQYLLPNLCRQAINMLRIPRRVVEHNLGAASNGASQDRDGSGCCAFHRLTGSVVMARKWTAGRDLEITDGPGRTIEIAIANTIAVSAPPCMAGPSYDGKMT